tara:strand:- start:653 stop:1165 length:513 start_codon:yes stop_codon:yes gene_type:complete
MNRRALLVTLQLMSFMAFAPQDASAQGPGDSKRILRLFSEFKCKCPKEDWTRTLAGCFEPCVDPQKALVRKLVAQGLDDDAIRARMIEDAGTEKVIARPSAAAWILLLPNLFPITFFVFLGGGVVLMLMKMRKQTRLAEDGAAAALQREHQEPSTELADRVEEELNRLKD